jgi:hypothetical protein
MNKLPRIIGLTGFARSGKDTFFTAINMLSRDMNLPDFRRFAFADELKKECDPFLLNNIGISAWTQENESKELIRPFLVTYGTHIRRKLDQNCWINKIKDSVEYCSDNGEIPVITDVRYENEAQWIKENDGVIVDIIRQSVVPANEEEKRESLKLMNYRDFVVSWPTFGNDSMVECLSFARSFLSDIDCYETSFK